MARKTTIIRRPKLSRPAIVALAVLGALLLCVAQELAVPLMGPSYKLVLSFVVLALVLLVRPAGIMGRVQLVR